jgi:GR25 family glycosyltransferase involved in LPS biosynthesis
VEQFLAVDGKQVLENGSVLAGDVQMDWDATINASYSRKAPPGPRVMLPGEVGCALSHVALWRELAETDGDPRTTTMLILEDDAVVTHGKRNRYRTRFAAAFANAWKQLPDDWSMLYLGLSHRGERIYIDYSEPNNCWPDPATNPKVLLYRPNYGYHTHAYVINKAAAQKLIQSLPVVGPIDVWLGDNKWFDMPVYCAVIAGEGYRLDDGTYEGMDLVIQNRSGNGFESDVQQPSG